IYRVERRGSPGAAGGNRAVRRWRELVVAVHTDGARTVLVGLHPGQIVSRHQTVAQIQSYAGIVVDTCADADGIGVRVGLVVGDGRAVNIAGAAVVNSTPVT